PRQVLLPSDHAPRINEGQSAPCGRVVDDVLGGQVAVDPEPEPRRRQLAVDALQFSGAIGLGQAAQQGAAVAAGQGAAQLWSAPELADGCVQPGEAAPQLGGENPAACRSRAVAGQPVRPAPGQVEDGADGGGQQLM